jgi:hypothetical protein
MLEALLVGGSQWALSWFWDIIDQRGRKANQADHYIQNPRKSSKKFKSVRKFRKNARKFQKKRNFFI